MCNVSLDLDLVYQNAERHHVSQRSVEETARSGRKRAFAKADMAAYGGAAAVAALGNQIFVTLQKGSAWPPLVVDVRYASPPLAPTLVFTLTSASHGVSFQSQV